MHLAMFLADAASIPTLTLILLGLALLLALGF